MYSGSYSPLWVSETCCVVILIPVGVVIYVECTNTCPHWYVNAIYILNFLLTSLLQSFKIMSLHLPPLRTCFAQWRTKNWVLFGFQMTRFVIANFCESICMVYQSFQLHTVSEICTNFKVWWGGNELPLVKWIGLCPQQEDIQLFFLKPTEIISLILGNVI